MCRKFLKQSIFSFILVLFCLCFAGCGKQGDSYNADEVTHSTDKTTDQSTEDVTADNPMESTDTNRVMGDRPEQDLEDAGENLGEGIENIGESILDGAEDLIDGDSSEADRNTHNNTTSTESNTETKKNRTNIR